MKKSKLIIFIMILFLGIFFLMPVKVFAIDSMTRQEWYNYISQFDFGIAYGEIDSVTGDILIVEEPEHEYEGYLILCRGNPDCFEPDLAIIQELVYNEQDISWYLEQNFEDFDGYLYWNFEEKYWQVEYYDSSDFGNNNNNNKEVDMVTDLLDTLSEIGAGIGDLFGRIVESVGQFFYTPGTGDTPGSFTIVGILTIAAVVVSLSMWVLRLILRLFKLRG